MAAAVFILCAVTSGVCGGLLLRGWRHSGVRLLLFAALCFIGFTVNNVMLVVDELLLPDRDLELTRDLSGFAAVAVLLVGLIWDATEERR
jgi:hypothetical protein